MDGLQRTDLVGCTGVLLGSYAFAITLSSLIHEVGHIIAMYYIGITQFRLVINPLTESYVSPMVSLPSQHMLFLSTSGMVFQLIVTTIVAVLLWPRKSTMNLPLLMIFPLSLLNVGGYLLMGSIVEGSDVVLMEEAGLPIMGIKLAGILFTLAGAYIYTQVLPLSGVRKSDPWLYVTLPLLLSIGTYALAMLVYGYYSGYGTMIGTLNVILTPFLTVIFTLLFKYTGSDELVNAISKPLTIKILTLGVASVVIPLIIF